MICSKLLEILLSEIFMIEMWKKISIHENNYMSLLDEK